MFRVFIVHVCENAVSWSFLDGHFVNFLPLKPLEENRGKIVLFFRNDLQQLSGQFFQVMDHVEGREQCIRIGFVSFFLFGLDKIGQ